MSADNGTFQVRRRAFTVIYDDQLRQGMSLRAWGLYSYLVGRPHGWECRTYDIADHFKEGRDAIRRARDELVALGLLVREQYKPDGRPPRWRYVLDPDAAADPPRSEPAPENPPRAEGPQTRRSAPAPGKPTAGNPAPGKPTAGNPAPGNPPQVSKEVRSTDLRTTDLRSTPPTPSTADGSEDEGALFSVPGPPSSPPAEPPPETEGQRVNRLTRTYTDAVPLSNFPAVAGVVRKAVRAERGGRPAYAEEEIRDALTALADEGRSVTADTLRVAIEGLPAASPRTSPADARLANGVDLVARLRAAEAAAPQPQPQIGAR
jgi:hypothetical protein